MRLIIIASLVLLLAGCGTQQVIEHPVAVPVEKLVYMKIDWTKFQCPDKPQPLTAGKTNSALLQNRDSWQVRAECLDDELQKIQSLQNQN